MKEPKTTDNYFDLKIIWRLLIYARPFIFWIILSLIILLTITGLELARPLIIGQAIDRFINSHRNSYYIIPPDAADRNKDIQFKGIYLARKQPVGLTGLKKAQLIYWNNRYYFFSGLSEDELQYLRQYSFNDNNQSENRYLIVIFRQKTLTGERLTTEELAVIRNGDFKGILYSSLFYFLILIGIFGLSYFQSVLIQYTGQKIIYQIRHTVYTHILSLSSRFFDKNPIGRLVTRVTNDTETLNEMYTSVIDKLLKNIFMIIGIMIMMIHLNLKLSLFAFTIVPVILLVTIIFRYMARNNYRTIRKLIANINAFLSEHIGGMKIIQIFSVEKKVFNTFKRLNKDLNTVYIKEITIFGIFRPSMFLLNMMAVSILIYFGGSQVLENIITIGELFVFLQYIDFFFHPVFELAEQFSILQAALASSERIFQILDEKPEITNRPNAVKIEKINGNIEFKNVWFAYNNEDWVLKDISFTIRPGDSIALVGATGSGKTTVINLICRYYDLQKGQIFIDGMDIKDIDLASLRSHIGQVMQDVFIFTGTINSNIRLLDTRITDEMIRQSAVHVNAGPFIRSLPEGYQHLTAERGATFSTGERQLLSFARALAFQPSLLVLDEATANIDTESEQLIQDALLKMMAEKTSIVIAHRLSTIQHSNKILVLHKGRIVESGNHQELLKNKGIYYNLSKLQYGSR